MHRVGQLNCSSSERQGTCVTNTLAADISQGFQIEGLSLHSSCFARARCAGLASTRDIQVMYACPICSRHAAQGNTSQTKFAPCWPGH
jgi:hypothetical protein